MENADRHLARTENAVYITDHDHAKINENIESGKREYTFTICIYKIKELVRYVAIIV